MATAKVLTAQFGEYFNYRDTVTYYGLKARDYKSFIEAALEVSESRILGGIHYRFGVEHGMNQGRLLGDLLNTSFNKVEKE